MCFPKPVEKECLTGVRKRLLHVGIFSPDSAQTAPLNSSTTLGNKGQEFFPRKGLNLSSDQCHNLLRRAVPFTW